MNKALALLVLGVIILTAAPVGAQDGTLRVWTVGAMTRIEQDAPPQTAPDIHIFAARSEYESFQVVVSGVGTAIRHADFTLTDFHGPGDSVIAQTNVTRYREHYVHVVGSRIISGHVDGDPIPNPPLGDSWYADALIPFTDPATGQPPTGGEFRAAPFGVAAGQNQPLWVDVLVPRDARPGDYNAIYTVSADQGTANGTVTLTVWNFALPEYFSSGSSFQLWNTHTTAAEIELLKHHMQPLNIDPADARMLRDQWGLTQVGLGFWGDIYYQTCADHKLMAAPPTLDEVQAQAALYPSELRLYNQSADEIDGCVETERDRMIAWDKVMRQAGAAQAITMTPANRMLYTDVDGQTRSAVDIWVMLPLMYDQAAAAVDAALKRGEQIWSYTALVQDDYSPKWEIDFPPVNYRLMQGFINQSLGLTGFMYWSVDSWTDDPWHDVNIKPDPSAPEWPWPPGDGMLFYPGEQVGLPGTLVPSVRAKWVRDGFEDYEYIQLLKNAGQSDLALQIARSVGADWHHWTRSPADLDIARATLAGAIIAAQNSH